VPSTLTISTWPLPTRSRARCTSLRQTSGSIEGMPSETARVRSPSSAERRGVVVPRPARGSRRDGCWEAERRHVAGADRGVGQNVIADAGIGLNPLGVQERPGGDAELGVERVAEQLAAGRAGQTTNARQLRRMAVVPRVRTVDAIDALRDRYHSSGDQSGTGKDQYIRHLQAVLIWSDPSSAQRGQHFTREQLELAHDVRGAACRGRTSGRSGASCRSAPRSGGSSRCTARGRRR